MPQKKLTIALAGNPNAGKTTIFNTMTGSRQKVGNWPGVTVEKKEGRVSKFGYDLDIIDLPGTYSLTPFSIEEIVVRDYILDQTPDVVIDIIDASNLERSLYLATQLRELDCCKVLFALNMSDLAKTRGIRIDAAKLSELLNVPVMFTVGNKNEGIDDLIKEAIALAEAPASGPMERRVKYSKDIERSVAELVEFIDARSLDRLDYNTRWASIKLIENDAIIKKRLLEKMGADGQDIIKEGGRLRGHLQHRFNDDPEIIMTDERYGFIAGIIKETFSTSTRERVDISRNIDLILTNRFIGFPIFIFLIWAMFQLTFSLGSYPMEWIEAGVNLLSLFADGLLPEGLVKDLVLNGIIAGVGSVLVFLPNILILFFCIAILEDSGYMSRAAFLMDKIMHLIGLHGKSFIPMLMGFGCNVPAIMAARTLESEKDRILTILITPFMSCSARLPVYIVLAGTFFGARAGMVIFIIYLTGIAFSIISGRLFRSTLLRGVDAPFVMELPPYRMPMLRSLLIHMWDRSKIFLKKMGGIILIGSIIVWGLATFPTHTRYTRDYDQEARQIRSAYSERMANVDPAEQATLAAERNAALKTINREKSIEKTRYSFLGRIGQLLEPLFEPAGIEWRGSVALLTGLVAKEIVVSTMGVLYAAGGDEPEMLENALKASGMTPLSALAMMFFVLLYVPCFATVTAIFRETGSAKWAIFSVFYSTSAAWIMAFCIYQGGTLLGF